MESPDPIAGLRAEVRVSSLSRIRQADGHEPELLVRIEVRAPPGQSVLLPPRPLTLHTAFDPPGLVATGEVVGGDDAPSRDTTVVPAGVNREIRVRVRLPVDGAASGKEYRASVVWLERDASGDRAEVPRVVTFRYRMERRNYGVIAVMGFVLLAGAGAVGG
jgi:hypothetical protein